MEANIRVWLHDFANRFLGPFRKNIPTRELVLYAQLRQAIRDGSLAEVRAAIEAGANLSACGLDDEGFHTPYELACKHGNQTIIEEIRSSLAGRSLKEEGNRMEAKTNATLVFEGELDVEDDSFACHVDRFIVSGNRAAIQMTCNDEGGLHTAEGTFEMDGTRWRTRSFSVKYQADGSDQDARFRLDSATLSGDGRSIVVEAEWYQAGDSYSLEGRLERFHA